ncbi:Uncharacterized ACR, COG1678 [Seminavis robusta]|uniref:Uncharacterized ACR, COG1678 n=1 Tax=Seminavis robusta TaxID=568900 RepID=A0A9N8EDS4_9STRA|nr:Uncharacterized ACR, COG1678 [Seminavis robusta]|eukprot:Sro1029_g233220.1 Uncharacterized ACR, COG1678 (496) ;mRNA; f:2883-4509
MATSSKHAVIHRRLYRALLRAVKPFTPPSPNAAVLSCLLHRSFIPVDLDEELALKYRRRDSQQQLRSSNYDLDLMEEEEDDEDALPQRFDAHFLLFRRLLWTVFSDSDTYKFHHDGVTRNDDSPPFAPCYFHPHHVHRQPTKLRDMIRREFRTPDMEASSSSCSAAFAMDVRRETAFLALRKLNEKLAWAKELQEEQQRDEPSHNKQAAKHVEPLIWNDATDIASLLKPGVFLVAHPHMTGFFRKTVSCILQHHGNDNHNKNTNEEDDNTDKDKQQVTLEGTYGLIVNRVTLKDPSNSSGSNLQPLNLAEALPHLPKDILASLGTIPMKDGGPVHMPTIQMAHTIGSSNDDSNDTEKDGDVGGIQLPNVTGLEDEKVVAYKGNITNAAEAVASGTLDRDDVTFFVGASCWYQGQLEREVAEGCWFLCRGPPEIVVSGACEHHDLAEEEEGESRPRADLWLSMMSAFGREEARLAHWTNPSLTTEDHKYGAPCDEF